MKHSVHHKLRVLKVYIEDLHSNRGKKQTQPQWLKEILVKNGTIK